ncbi:MAG TPA: TolC family protein [Myxococcota bacterium]|nr:TolC family protein [Myxococcota bacterium]
MHSLIFTLVVLANQTPLTLDSCIREALARHPDVVISGTEVRRAEAQKLSTRTGYLPSVDLYLQDGYLLSGKQDYIYSGGGDTYSYERSASQNDTHSFSLRLSQNIFDGLKMFKQVDRADREIDRARLGVAAARNVVALSVIQSFYQLFKAQDQLDVLNESLDLSRGQLELAQERLKLGAASRVDVAKARVSAGEDRIAQEQQKQIIAAARVALNQAMGRDPRASLEIVEDGARESSLPGAQAQAPAVPESHFKLQEIELSKEVAGLDVDIAKGDWWPRVTGSISYTRQDPEFYRVYSRFDELYTMTFLVNVSFPIFDAFLRSSKIEEAKTQVTRWREEERKARIDLQGRLSCALDDLARFETIAKIEARNVVDAEQQLLLARERYQVGEGTALEIRDAQLSVTRARLAEVQTQYDFKIAAARLHYARGDLIESYVRKENQ